MRGATERDRCDSRPRDRSAAFTLIELLVVVAIVGILSAVASSHLVRSREKARVARAETDLTTLAESFEFLKEDTEYYPLGGETLCCCLPVDSPSCKAFIHEPCMGILDNECPPTHLHYQNWKGPYIKNPVQDPLDGHLKVLDPWGRPYIFDKSYTANDYWFGAVFSGGPNQSGMNVYDEDNIVRPLCPCGEVKCEW